MTDLVVVPRLRRLLSERRLALDEFHRRLVARGDAPSRAALGRLAQERPIRVIRMETVLPILEELAVPFGTLFESLPCAEWERRELANGQARAVATTLVDRNGRRSPLSADKETAPPIRAQLKAWEDAGYGPASSFDRNRVSVILGVTGTLELVIPLGARLGHPRWRRALKEAGVQNTVAEEVVRRINAARHHGRAP